MSPPEATLADRIAGAIFGAAIGDALGHPTEFLSLEELHREWGPAGVQGYELLWSMEGASFAPYTDDTQMALCVWEALLAEGGNSTDALMNHLAGRFVAWSRDPPGGHRAPGNACLAGCRRLADGVPWAEAGGARAGGCGSVMRAYPFGLYYRDDPERAEARAVEHSRLTHRDPIALAACAAMALGVRAALEGNGPESVAQAMVTAAEQELAVRGRSERDERAALEGNGPESVAQAMVTAAERHDPSTAGMMARAAREAGEGVGPEVTLDRLRAWAAHEAIAAAVYLFLRHPDDPRAALLEGANTPGDSDSIATLAGALTGARCGLGALPEAWVAKIENREGLEALSRRALLQPEVRAR